ncbi:putative tetratricopeptide-like helical domain superfamily [Helianthus annuus]|nr:putative tetratricopeptide-like helical domain superfamily [Helianthus annuus]KAJ0696878.1 putative tetratricopeptide-like helical domain superfamily [Helianthus annuus]KAJ0879622.1 putative tetratricopeptide-like helical domain superfamily [Helianthus annuus]
MSIRWPRVLTPTYLSQIIQNQKNPSKALHIFNEARNRYPNYRHNGPVYATMINILSTSNRIADMKQVIDQMKEDSCECQDSVFSTSIITYAKAGMLNEAVALFRNLDQFNCVNWTESFNTILKIMVKESKLESAHHLFLENFGKWEVKSRTRSLTWLIDVLCEKKRSDLALQVFQEMNSQYCYPTRETYQVLMKGLCEDGRINEAIHLLYSMFWKISRRGSGEDVLVYKILLDTLCAYGHVDEASDILNKVLRKGLKAPKKKRTQLDFNMCRNGRDIESAKSLVNNALIKGVIPSYESYNAMAVQLYAEGDINGAERVVQEMHDQGFKPQVVIYEAKVMALCKQSMINEAEKVITEDMVEGNCVPTVKLYNILIKGLCCNGKSTRALGFLNKMCRQSGCVPNKETYTVLVDGLCDDGSFIEASQLLEKMLVNSYWPDTDTFSRVINGLCLMGRPYEGVVWLEEMVSQEKIPEYSAWTSLVGSVIHDTVGIDVLSEILYS